MEAKVPFFTTCSRNYRPVFDLMLKSYLATGLSFRDLHVHHYTLPPGPVGFKTAHWYTALVTKCKYFNQQLVDSLKMGEMGVFMDADIQVFPAIREELGAWDRRMAARDLDFLFMQEGSTKEVNGGLMVIRKTPRSMLFIHSVAAEIERNHEEMGEQTIINRKILRRPCPIKFEVLDAELVVWGRELPAELKSVCLHHAVCCDGNVAKMQQMRDVACAVLPAQHIPPAPRSPHECQIVLCRYAERLDDIDRRLIRPGCTVVYNKGSDISIPGATIVRLANVGREGHAFLYHIVANYDDLAVVTLFSQARTSDCMCLDVERYLETNTFCAIVHNVGHGFLQANRWVEGENQGFGYIEFPEPYLKAWQTGQMQRSHKSLAEFFIEYISPELPPEGHCITTFNGIFSVHRDHIRRHSREYYCKLLTALSNHCNPEQGHALERLWFHVFMNHAEAVSIQRPEKGHIAITDR